MKWKLQNTDEKSWTGYQKKEKQPFFMDQKNQYY
jgi:hypothetical protein